VAAAERWGLDWFPADASCYGAFELRSFRQITPQDPSLQALMRKYLPAGFVNQVNTPIPGTCRIDRVSFASCSDPVTPAKSCVFLRLTGQMDHQWLAALLRDSLPGAIVEEWGATLGEVAVSPSGKALQGRVARVQRIHPGTVPVTVVTSPNLPWGVMLVGGQDVVLARHQGDNRQVSEPRMLLDQAFRIREGMEVGMQNRPFQVSFGTRPSSPVGILEGKVPDMIRGWPEFKKWFPITPRQVALQVTRDQYSTIQCVLTPVKPGDASVILENANLAKQQAAGELAEFVAGTSGQSKDQLMIRALARIAFYMTPGAASGAPPAVAGGGKGGKRRSPDAMTASGQQTMPSVGGTWTLSADELNAFEKLLRSQL
jgi:hypothetical protein